MAGERGEEFRVDGRRVRRLLEAAQLAPFTRLDDRRGVLAPALTFLAIALLVWAGWSAWQAGAWALVAACALLMGTQQHALFVLAHEAAHYRLFSSRALNDAIGRLAATLGGISMCTYRVTHRLHHNHLYGTQDPDLALNAGYPRGRAYLVRKLLIDLSGRTAPRTYAYFFGAPAIDTDARRALRPLDDTSPALRTAARRDRGVVVAFHLGAPLVALLLGGWRGLAAYAVLWLLPLATVLQALLRLRAVAEHGAPAGYESPLTAARTNLPGRGPLGWLVRLALFPHHVNYHIEHHLYPAVPHYRLAALHRRLDTEGLLQGAEVRPFTDTLRRVFAPRGSVVVAGRHEGLAHPEAADAPRPNQEIRT
jgi:fatty acid desaturase